MWNNSGQEENSLSRNPTCTRTCTGREPPKLCGIKHQKIVSRNQVLLLSSLGHKRNEKRMANRTAEPTVRRRRIGRRSEVRAFTTHTGLVGMVVTAP
jgi:hypothetical protein